MGKPAQRRGRWGRSGFTTGVRGHLEGPPDKPVLCRLQGGGTVPAPSALETGRDEETAVTQPRCPWKGAEGEAPQTGCEVDPRPLPSR